MTLTALLRYHGHGLKVLAAKIFLFWKHLHLTKAMPFTNIKMVCRNTSRMVLLSFLMLIKYHGLAWPWKSCRFHPSQLLLPERERTRRKNIKEARSDIYKPEKKNWSVVECEVPLSSCQLLWWVYSEHLHWTGAEGFVSQTSPPLKADCLSAVPTRALLITRGRWKEWKVLPLSQSGFMSYFALLKQAAVRNAVRFISISSHQDRCWPSLNPFKDIKNNGH